MKYRTTRLIQKKIIRIGRRDMVLFKQIEKQLILFESNEKHPSLRIHKLKGRLKDYWSLSVGMGIRMIYFIEDDEACFVDIGTHDEVYRMN